MTPEEREEIRTIVKEVLSESMNVLQLFDEKIAERIKVGVFDAVTGGNTRAGAYTTQDALKQLIRTEIRKYLVEMEQQKWAERSNKFPY